MTAQEKIAYIKGLMEGLELDKNSKEAKLFAAIVDALDVIAEEIEEVKDDVFDLNEYAEAMDEDLYDVEEMLFDDECCGDYAEFDCPECGETICLEEEDFGKDSVICPCCGKEIFLDEVCDDCCDCDDCSDDEANEEPAEEENKEEPEENTEL